MANLSDHKEYFNYKITDLDIISYIYVMCLPGIFFPVKYKDKFMYGGIIISHSIIDINNTLGIITLSKYDNLK